MTVEATYRVVASGGVISGFKELDVVSSFAKLFGTTSDKAASYLQADTLINQNLSKARADDYKVKIESLGIPVTLVLETPETDTALETQSIEFTCPKCQLAQDRGAECAGCGIIFEKYNNGKKPVAPQERSNISPDSDTDKQTLPITAFIAPLIAAVVGALIWKAIALAFGYELGLVAWGIGGAVGAAAAITGGRGEVIGGYCAVLALLAIFSGKYMVMSSHQQEFASLFDGEYGSAIMADFQDEAEYDAEVFATIDKSDASVKSYMVDHAFSDADASIFVTDRELEDFRNDVQPWLESDTPEKMYTEEFGDEPTLASALSSASPAGLVFQSLGFIDILFAFLGLSTAFQLGRSGFANKQ